MANTCVAGIGARIKTARAREFLEDLASICGRFSHWTAPQRAHVP